MRSVLQWIGAGLLLLLLVLAARAGRAQDVATTQRSVDIPARLEVL